MGKEQLVIVADWSIYYLWWLYIISPSFPKEGNTFGRKKTWLWLVAITSLLLILVTIVLHLW